MSLSNLHWGTYARNYLIINSKPGFALEFLIQCCWCHNSHTKVIPMHFLQTAVAFFSTQANSLNGTRNNESMALALSIASLFSVPTIHHLNTVLCYARWFWCSSQIVTVCLRAAPVLTCSTVPYPLRMWLWCTKARMLYAHLGHCVIFVSCSKTFLVFYQQDFLQTGRGCKLALCCAFHDVQCLAPCTVCCS